MNTSLGIEDCWGFVGLTSRSSEIIRKTGKLCPTGKKHQLGIFEKKDGRPSLSERRGTGRPQKGSEGEGGGSEKAVKDEEIGGSEKIALRKRGLKLNNN